MRKLNVLVTGLIVGAAAVLPSASSAQTLRTFGQSITRGTTPVGSVVFNQATGVLGVSGGSAGVPMSFVYKSPNGYDSGDNNINSIFRFTAQIAAGPATINGNAFDVTFTNIQFSFTAVTPGAFGATNLLSGSFATGTLTGTVNNGAANFSSGVSQNPVTTGVVGYSSDFLDFSNSGAQKIASEQFALALSAVNTANGNGPRFDANNNMLSFTADPTGTFSSDPLPPSLMPTPAPPGVVSGLIGIAMGGAQFGMMRFRKRRSAKKSEAAA